MASAWSHRGGRLALQAAERSTTGAATGNLLVIRDQDGSERVIGRCRAPSCTLVPVDWTPDDSAILVTSRLSGERRTSLSLWSVQTAAETPAAVLVSDPDWNASQGAFSPDGRWLAFAYGGEFRDESGIAVVPAAGRVGQAGWRPIAEGYEYRGNPRWSPDGRFLYFSASHQSLHLNVWRVGVSASAPFFATAPTAVTAFRGAGFFLLNRSYYPRVAVGADRVILPMNSQKMATWMIDNVDR
jgi:Tol biopolymer transport system component